MVRKIIKYDPKSRRSIYYALLKAKGRNNVMDYAHNEKTRESSSFVEPHPYKPVIDWIEKGWTTYLNFMFVWTYDTQFMDRTGIKDKNYTAKDGEIKINYISKRYGGEEYLTVFVDCPHCGRRVKKYSKRRCPHCNNKLEIEN